MEKMEKKERRGQPGVSPAARAAAEQEKKRTMNFFLSMGRRTAIEITYHRHIHEKHDGGHLRT